MDCFVNSARNDGANFNEGALTQFPQNPHKGDFSELGNYAESFDFIGGRRQN